jgi:hypothetical protein
VVGSVMVHNATMSEEVHRERASAAHHAKASVAHHAKASVAHRERASAVHRERASVVHRERASAVPHVTIASPTASAVRMHRSAATSAMPPKGRVALAIDHADLAIDHADLAIDHAALEANDRRGAVLAVVPGAGSGGDRPTAAEVQMGYHAETARASSAAQHATEMKGVVGRARATASTARVVHPAKEPASAADAADRHPDVLLTRDPRDRAAVDPREAQGPGKVEGQGHRGDGATTTKASPAPGPSSSREGPGAGFLS